MNASMNVCDKNFHFKVLKTMSVNALPKFEVANKVSVDKLSLASILFPTFAKKKVFIHYTINTRNAPTKSIQLLLSSILFPTSAENLSLHHQQNTKCTNNIVYSTIVSFAGLYTFPNFCSRHKMHQHSLFSCRLEPHRNDK